MGYIEIMFPYSLVATRKLGRGLGLGTTLGVPSGLSSSLTCREVLRCSSEFALV